MKKAVILLALVLLVLSCTTTTDRSAGPGSGDEKRGGDDGFEEKFEPVPEVEELLERWLRALHKEDLDLFMEAYWPEARLEMYYEDPAPRIPSSAPMRFGRISAGFSMNSTSERYSCRSRCRMNGRTRGGWSTVWIMSGRMSISYSRNAMESGELNVRSSSTELPANGS
jgi:hypothetical protein